MCIGSRLGIPTPSLGTVQFPATGEHCNHKSRWRLMVFILPGSSHVQSRVADICEGSVSKWRFLHTGPGAVVVGQAPMYDKTTTLPPADQAGVRVSGIVGLGV